MKTKKQTKKRNDKDISKILGKVNNAEKIQKEHSKKLEKLDKIEKVQKEYGERLDEHGEMLSRLIEVTSDNKERLDRIEENMFTKEEGQMILDAIDSFAGTVSRLDDENVAGTEATKRVSDGLKKQKVVIDRHEKDIRKLKVKVGVA